MNIEVAAVAQNMTGIGNYVILSQRHIPYIRNNRIPLIFFWRKLTYNI